MRNDVVKVETAEVFLDRVISDGCILRDKLVKELESRDAAIREDTARQVLDYVSSYMSEADASAGSAIQSARSVFITTPTREDNDFIAALRNAAPDLLALAREALAARKWQDLVIDGSGDELSRVWEEWENIRKSNQEARR